MTETPTTVRPLIGGRRVDANTDARFGVVNPATEESEWEVVDSSPATVDAAVRTAKSAHAEWSRLSPSARGEFLGKWAGIINNHIEEVARLDTLSMGKPLRDSISEVNGTVRRARYWAGMSDKITGRFLPVVPGHVSYTVREPLGVVAAIIPWNGPSSSFVGRVSAALACGNTVVVKPSEYSPLSAIRLAELALEAGIPEGVINVVTGLGPTGAALANHPDVAGICFTGSVATGRKIAQAAAGGFKRTVLELGGKSPNIIMPDADLDEAIRGSLWGIFYNSGQVCCAGTRLLVHDAVADQVVESLAFMARDLKVGDPMEPDNQLGPLVSARQKARVASYIELAAQEGVVDVTGETVPIPGQGWFVAPRIFDRVPDQSALSSEEIFGPILSIFRFTDEAEAIQRANDTPFGLSATIWTSDLGTMHRMAEAVDAAVVWGNTMRLFHPALPFGGFKDSGIGSTSGEEAVDSLTRAKRVSIRIDPSAPTPEWAE